MTDEKQKAFSIWLNLVKVLYPDAKLVPSINPKNNYRILYTCPTHGLLYLGYGNGVSGLNKVINNIPNKKHLCQSCSATAQLTKTLAQNTEDIKKLILTRHLAGMGLLVEFLGMRKIDKECKFKCPEHGIFYKNRNAYRDNIIYTCEGCSKGSGLRQNDSRFILALNKSKRVLANGEIYKGSYTPIKLLCVKHNKTFNVVPNTFVSAKKEPIGCAQCRCEYLSKPNTKLTLLQVNKSLKIKNNKIKCIEYGGSLYLNKWQCLDKHCKYEWEKIGSSWEHLEENKGCPKCATGRSLQEKFLYEFVLSLAPDAMFSYRLYLNNDKRKFLELDIYVPSKNLAIEFNGTYWHSSAMIKRANSTITKVKNRHADKTNACLNKGIKLLHIWEHDWQDKKELIKNIIKSALIKQPNINCSLTEIKVITNLKIINNFYAKNSIHGTVKSVNITLALKYNNEYVLIITLKPVLNLIKTYEIVKIATSLNVVGGIEKILTYFISNYKPENIIGYSDQQYSKGLGYKKLGFIKTVVTKSNYKVIWAMGKINKILDKSSILKSNLIKVFGSKFDKSKTVAENCSNLNLHKIYDAGKIKWELNLTKES